MIPSLGERQQEVLYHLLRNKAGLTIDEIEGLVGVTRTAIVQHIAALESEGYVSRGELRSTGGRPVRVYTLTAKGIDLFPKQYSWFASLLLGVLEAELGTERSVALLETVAGNVAESLLPRLRGLDRQARFTELVKILNELSFDAALETAGDGPELTAANCVYHHLAAQFPQVCGFDIALLSRLAGEAVTQSECIVRGGAVCRFRFSPPNSKG